VSMEVKRDIKALSRSYHDRNSFSHLLNRWRPPGKSEKPGRENEFGLRGERFFKGMEKASLFKVTHLS